MEINFNKQNVIVTGGLGFIGSHLVKRLTENNNQVTVIDINLNPKSFFVKNNLGKKANLLYIDIRNKAKLTNAISQIKPDFIFHLAAQAIVDDAYKDPVKTLETNIMGTVNLLEIVRFNSSVKAIIVASSDKAYGKKTSKYTENDQLKGDHPYEVSKSSADLISQAYYATYHTPVVVTRFGNVYGEGDLNYSRIIPGIMESIICNKILPIRSDGSFVRDYIYVQDVVDGYLRIANDYEKKRGEAYNFGSRETLSVIQLLKKVENIVHKKINYKILNSSRNEIPKQSLDYSKINKETGWNPTHTLEQTINNIYMYYKEII